MTARQVRFEIASVRTERDVEATRQLFREYAASLDFDLGFQDFERELRELPNEYAPPRGRLLLARVEESPAGCVAVRPLDEECCEMKRLYVRRGFRRLGLGRALAQAAIDVGRTAGYARMRLDTVPQMAAARALYRTLGFREIDAYRFNPIQGTAYMELTLPKASGEAALG